MSLERFKRPRLLDKNESRVKPPKKKVAKVVKKVKRSK